MAELDLTDNLISDWQQVLSLLDTFPSLEFLNLSNNMLNHPIDPEAILNSPVGGKKLPMRKFALNGNRVDWSTVSLLTRLMPDLEELYLSTNNLGNPRDGDNNNVADEDIVFKHGSIRQLFLSCNPLDNFDEISEHVVMRCPNLQLLSLAECPVNTVPSFPTDEGKRIWKCLKFELFEMAFSFSGPICLTSLNLSTTQISSWEEVDKLRNFPSLTELRLQHCPVLRSYTAHERRMLLVARLPNIQVLNGGGKITANEREDAERAFIR